MHGISCSIDLLHRRRTFFALLVLAAVFCAVARPAFASELPHCKDAQMQPLNIAPVVSARHRTFKVPMIDYPPGTGPDQTWNFILALRVSASGHVVCYRLRSIFADSVAMNRQRRAFLHKVLSWEYTPFKVDGHAVPVIVAEPVSEQALPGKHVPLPEVPLDQVRIRLSRSQCFGTCPAYSVTIDGDGRVTYHGKAYVVVTGIHHTRIPQAKVARLVERIRTGNLWSMRKSYAAPITDLPSYTLNIRMGKVEHSIRDYAGNMIGMPVAVRDFEQAVDDAAGTQGWIHFNSETLRRLRAEGYRFDSPAAGTLLARAVADSGSHDDAAMLKLIRLGAPLDRSTARTSDNFALPDRPLIVEALLNRRDILIAPLIARGALDTNGRPDPVKINAAFRAAIRGGRLKSVEKIWNLRGSNQRPSLTYADDDADAVDGHSYKLRPVTLLLHDGEPREDMPWQGLAIARWLLGKGCDIHAISADGETLLHAAAEANDPAFVRYLLQKGLSVDTYGPDAAPALGSTTDQDVAMLLIKAGSDPWQLETPGYSFLHWAHTQHWTRVVAWMKSHPRPHQKKP
jgi:hypothetical protein